MDLSLYNAQGKSKFSSACCHQKRKPQHCKTVTKIKTRKSILRKKGKCFLCLRDGHVLRNCTQSFTCFKCEGKHHISIYDEKKEHAIILVKTFKSSLQVQRKKKHKLIWMAPLVMYCFKQRLQMFMFQTSLKVRLFIDYLIVAPSLVMLALKWKYF